ncbi:hypothetical protein HWV62_25204 [Athelia sp. TMB]|nr:hypothetical protein HWV62_25204 [Athelia sp. TMB]
MPVATSSRRKTNGHSRREPSSDGIEDAAPTQEAADDDVDDEADEEEQPSRSARVKKEKKGGRSARKPAVEKDGDDDDDDRIDVNNFPDQPLSKESATAISGTIKDWEMIKTKTKQTAQFMESIGVSVADLMEADEAEKCLAELDTVMREVLDLDAEMAANTTTVNEIYQSLMSGGKIVKIQESPIEVYEKAVKKKINDYRGKTARQKYAKLEAYQRFRQGIYEAQHPGENIPPMADFLPRESEDADASDDDDDLEIGGVTQLYTCPLSLTKLIKPMTSKICGHSFSEQAIREFMKDGRGQKLVCPASGCNKPISMGDLEYDKALEKKAKLAERRAQRQHENSDDDEVIE